MTCTSRHCFVCLFSRHAFKYRIGPDFSDDDSFHDMNYDVKNVRNDMTPEPEAVLIAWQDR